MNVRNFISEVPVLLIFLEFKAESTLSCYLRPHYIKKSRKRELNGQSIRAMLDSFKEELEFGNFALCFHGPFTQTILCSLAFGSPFPRRVEGFDCSLGTICDQWPPLTLAQPVQQRAVRSEAHIWLDLCSLFQMWTNASCSVGYVVKPSVKMWKGPSYVCVLTKTRNTAPWPGSAAPGPREVSHSGSAWGLVPTQVWAKQSESEVRNNQMFWHTAVSGSFHAFSEPVLSVN